MSLNILKWLPLLNNNQLVHGDFNLPIACERPPHNYSFVPPTVKCKCTLL